MGNAILGNDRFNFSAGMAAALIRSVFAFGITLLMRFDVGVDSLAYFICIVLIDSYCQQRLDF